MRILGFAPASRRPRGTALTAVLTASLTAALTGATLTALTAATADAANAAAATRAAPRRIAYTRWATRAQLATGTPAGTRIAQGALRMATPIRTTTYAGHRYDVGRWTSPWITPKHPLTELVPSWAARTPDGTWIQVSVRGAAVSGTRGSWDTIARWASGDAVFHRTSLGPQRDDLARVATDTWEANAKAIGSWQLRVTLVRRAGSTRTPRVDTLGAMTSALPAANGVATSTPGVAGGIILDVPRYSQMVHAGEYPRYGGGGEAWCSPTSTTMVLAYDKALPPRADYAWVKHAYRGRVVDNTARTTYDYAYDGTGNWPFNTAYAATRTGRAFVTRLHSLREAERFIAAGIPVVASIAFGPGQLTGAPISSTAGHLVVVVGFTKRGNVVVNDPAAKTRAGVRRTYDRGQFEDAWLSRYSSGGSMHGSGGLVYVIRDAAHPLPPRDGNVNW